MRLSPSLMLRICRAGLLVGLCLVVGTGPNAAQAQSSLDYGARVSAVWSATTDRLAGSSDPLLGIAAAAYAQKPLAGPISVRLELAYLPRGFRQEILFVDNDGSSELTAAKTRLHYLSMPALATAGWSLGESPVHAYVLLGPRVEVLVGRSSGTFSVRDEEMPAGVADRYDTVTLGASGGVGIGVDVGDVTITAEALQHRDITPSVEEGGTSRANLTLGPLRNVATAVSVGVRW